MVENLITWHGFRKKATHLDSCNIFYGHSISWNTPCHVPRSRSYNAPLLPFGQANYPFLILQFIIWLFCSDVFLFINSGCHHVEQWYAIWPEQIANINSLRFVRFALWYTTSPIYLELSIFQVSLLGSTWIYLDLLWKWISYLDLLGMWISNFINSKLILLLHLQ